MKNMTVLGEGAWGTAIATLLAHNGYTVKLWCHDASLVHTIANTRVNERYLPGVMLSSLIEPTSSLQEALSFSEFLFETTPVPFLRSIVTKAKPFVDESQIWVILSKGIEQESLFLPSVIIDDVLGYIPHKAVISGPSFARDLAQHMCTGVALAATQENIAQRLSLMLGNHYFKTHETHDMTGVQLGGALKNCIAVGVGILHGAECGDNTKALLATRGFNEIVTLGQALGAHQETMYGLAGIGDLMLTAFGKYSKNVAVGIMLGQGQNIDMSPTSVLPEGIKTIKSVYHLIQRHELDLPILHGIYQMVFEDKSVKQFLHELMQ
ncbi:glycerol-3-phosphate dehydrogenase [NAD(P)+] [Candidatus Dependentiae bacterium Noda2021]|nr:glycerol-3-phosphate dehydrogenase [NAD(P)+] [Candidatus Dependentiae bacterium Noda2021]